MGVEGPSQTPPKPKVEEPTVEVPVVDVTPSTSEDDQRRWAVENMMIDEQKKKSEERSHSRRPTGRRYDKNLLKTELKDYEAGKQEDVVPGESSIDRRARQDAKIKDIQDRIKANNEMLRGKMDVMDPADRAELDDLDWQDLLLHGEYKDLMRSGRVKDEYDKELINLKIKIGKVGNRIGELESKYNI